jgi:DNA polymerase III epsilon subunit-like protein
MILVFDTETTGFPKRMVPGNLSVQPHIVELACAWFDVSDSGEKQWYGSFSSLVRPQGWEIPKEATDIHGITNGIAQQGGLPICEIMGCVLGLMRKADLIVGHNISFDIAMLDIECSRLDYPKVYLEKSMFCTMKESTDIVRLPPNPGFGGYKWPTLGEAYSFFTGREFQETHRALNDIQACIEIFPHLRDRWERYLKG